VTDGGAPLRVALLHHTYRSRPGPGPESLVHYLAAALRDAGHEPSVLTSHTAATRRSTEDGVAVIRSRRLPEAPRRWRNVAGPLTHLPLVLRALASGDYDVAHSFSPPDVLAALAWRRLTGSPALFTCAETLGRERLSDQRLRLWLLARAVEHSDAVTVVSEEARAALWRWLAVEAALIDPRDAAAHEWLYRELLARRRG
jgi:hypothetical protein